MNRLNRVNNKKTEKKLNKEIKKTLTSPPSKVGDALFLKEVKSRYKPRKPINKAKIERNIAIKLKKDQFKHSKRTTPGEILGQTGAEPKFAHIEGVRWNKVITLQNKDQSKRITKKSIKRTSRERNIYRKGA